MGYMEGKCSNDKVRSQAVGYQQNDTVLSTTVEIHVLFSCCKVTQAFAVIVPG